jgi:heme exporter protein C
MTSGKAMTALTAVAALSMLVGVLAVFFWVPTEEFQGIVQRIFYVHVPAAWIAYLAFAVVVVGSVAYLRTAATKWDLVARSSAEVGVVFAAINIVTGMLWGRPIWGTYWTWDARLTSMFVLLLIYVGYLTFRGLAVDQTRGARIAAVIGIVGFVDVPLVHFSVRWFRTQHPTPTVVLPESTPQLPTEMLAALLFMVGAFTLVYALLLVLRVRLASLESDVAALEAAM